jgi:glycerol uptake facilitator-like aquaporin
MNLDVTLAVAGTDRWHTVPAYLAAQIRGVIAGVWLAHVSSICRFCIYRSMSGPACRNGIPEVVAIFGLLMVIWGCRANKEPVTAFAVTTTSPAPTGSPPRPASPILRGNRASVV